jgi:hypothetical protein
MLILLPYPAFECLTDVYAFSYIGSNTKTSSGKFCQRWDSDNPQITQNKTYMDQVMQDDDPALGHNFCRNFDNDGTTIPWCYTTTRNTRWEVCTIPYCPGYP